MILDRTFLFKVFREVASDQHHSLIFLWAAILPSHERIGQRFSGIVFMFSSFVFGG